MMVVLFALLFVPMDASTAVIQVPMFIPKRTYTALEKGNNPEAAKVCKIPTDAEDD